MPADRLPTVSASQALLSLKSAAPRTISTGLQRLDSILHARELHQLASGFGTQAGGFVRGKVTEIYGPPGVGKTAFCLHAAATALCAGDHVVWVDASAPIPWPRLDQIISEHKFTGSTATGPDEGAHTSNNQVYNRFHHYTTPTLAHLLALILHPRPTFPPKRTTIIVIDAITTLFDKAYPRNAPPPNSGAKNETTRWAAGRKSAVTHELVSRLNGLAAVHNIAVLLTSQTLTRIRAGSALLVPSMTGAEWDGGIAIRLVLFRDWPPPQTKASEGDRQRLPDVRFVGVTKCGGIALAEDGPGVSVVPFVIGKSGVQDLKLEDADLDSLLISSPVRRPKRPFAEIADSDAEDGDIGSDAEYGWAEDDAVAAEGLVDEQVLDHADRPSSQPLDVKHD